MSGHDYRLGRVSPGLAAEAIPVSRPTGGQDRRSGEQYRAALRRETDASLNRSPRWRAGKPLANDERWPNTSSADLGSRVGPVSRALDEREAGRLAKRRERARKRSGGRP